MRAQPREAAVFATAGLLVLATVTLAVFAVPGVRSSRGFVPLVDGWVQGTGYVAAAVLSVLAVRRGTPDGSLWAWIATGLTCRAIGFVAFLSVVRRQQPQPYPSVADAFWLATYAFVMAGLAMAVHSRFRRLSMGVMLDGLTGALATAALVTASLYATLVDRVQQPAPHSVVITNLAYPVLDILLLLTMLGVLLAWAWQPPLNVWVLGAGIIGFAVSDIIFLIEVTAGEFGPGTWLSPFTLAATGLIAWAAWLSDRHDPRRAPDALPGLVLPGVFAALCVGLLVYATEHEVNDVAVALAGLGLTVAIVRTGIAFHIVRQVAVHRAEARTDELTGLANRRAFHEILRRALHERPDEVPAALLVMDLDNFKVVNDTLGHHYGDDLLRQVSARLVDGLRGHDVLARIGGDEFAVVLDGSDRTAATQVAERLGAGMRRSFPVASRELDVSASIGIALFPDDGRNPGDLLQHADLAMYQAKSAHTGHSLYRHQPHQAQLARLESVERLRRGIQDGEIVLHYQPVVALRTGAVVGVEALARWAHPGDGLVPPGGFLPQAESGGLMGLLTVNILEQAVRQTALWRSDGTEVTVAVNLSVTNLLDMTFPDQVRSVLERARLPGRAIQLELTEDLFMADPTRAKQVIAELLDTGVRLVVDDYGTGYSSLGYLRDLHEISGLKLDRSFVTHLDRDSRSAAIVESTLTLARSLGLSVVAEGVETAAVRDRLAGLGVELAQGFLFSRPIPAGGIRFGVIDRARAGS